jgi:hypothetical protein
VAGWQAEALEGDVGAIRVEQHAVVSASFCVDMQGFVDGAGCLSRYIGREVLEHIVET